MEFSIRSMKLLIQENTEKRVGEDSAAALGEFLDKWGVEVSKDALEIAEEDDRKTVRADDIRKALRNKKSRDIQEQFDL